MKVEDVLVRSSELEELGQARDNVNAEDGAWLLLKQECVSTGI